MWVRIVKTYICYILLGIVLFRPIECHLPTFASTPANKADLNCLLAEHCIHDTIPVCGKMNDQKKTFLDLCDMMEHACDTQKVYVHVEDEKTCGDFANPK